jgi:hypothetical protein
VNALRIVDGSSGGIIGSSSDASAAAGAAPHARSAQLIARADQPESPPPRSAMIIHTTHRPHPQPLAMDVMCPSEILGQPAPAADDPRHSLRVVFVQALVVLANVAAAAMLFDVLRR